jgi:ABC-type lipoprotein release transport system permease subunit
MISLALGLPLAALAGVRILVWTMVAAVPLAMAVAALAAVLPALAAARGTAMRVLTVGGHGRVRRSRPPRFTFTLGLRDLVGLWRTEALLGVIAITLGAAMLGTVVLVAAAFRGQLDTTVLGAYLGERVRPFHVAVAALTLAIGALAAGQIVTLGYLERQAQLAALRALGWRRAHVLRLLAAQGLALGTVGGLAGALAVWAVSAATGASPGATVLGALASVLVALVASALAVLGPLLQASHSRPAELLRGE